MEPAHKGTWFEDEFQAATDDKNKAYRKMQQGYGTRSLIEEYKENKRQFIKEIKKEYMNVELGNMELLRKKHECR